ncbi:type II toxin-antitoxin system RelE/ParE family toxin [bacterium]|nr:type II toxin-antitoxin system RelE/ParE family toxin [bacterium]
MKDVFFHPDAEVELSEAAKYYESLQFNLGKRFLVSVKDAIQRIEINPNLYPFVDLNTQRCLVKTFPFGVLYRNLSDKIIIIAVMHLNREPNYWKNRD